MYVPPAFREDDLAALEETMRGARLTNFVTARGEGLVATPLPLFLTLEEGPYGTLYDQLGRVSPQGKLPPTGDAMALFQGTGRIRHPPLGPRRSWSTRRWCRPGTTSPSTLTGRLSSSRTRTACSARSRG
jgi:transcriptional regulator